MIGQPIVLDNSPYTVVGVMPRAFRFPSRDEAVWTTMRLPEDAYQDRNDNWLHAVGRLRDGVSIDQARIEWNVFAAQSRRAYPKDNERVGVTMVRLADEVSQTSRLLLLALFGAALCVLLIACANLANLLLARALGRRRELAVRTAMGAGRERLGRQLITESLVLAIVGGALGVAVAAGAVPLLARLVPPTLPIPQSPSVDLRVLVFAAALTALTGIGFGLAPVLRVRGGLDLSGLREGSRGGMGRKEHLRSALVVAQIVASIVLLVSAGLLLRALWSVQATDPGFRAGGVLTLQTPLPMPQYGAVSTREAYYNRVLSDVRALPGVSHAAYISFLPMLFTGGIWPVSIDGKPSTIRADRQVASLRYVTPDFFATMGIPLEAGRDVADADTRDQPFVAVVSESFARRYWPNQDPLGRHFQFAFDDRTVVGVVGDIHVRGLEQPSEPQVYLSCRQVADNSIISYSPKDLVIRARSTPAALLPAIRGIVSKVDPKLPISDVQTLEEIVGRQTASRSVRAADHRGVRHHCLPAGRHRHPRPAVVRGVAASAGDRHPHGAWRRAGRYSAPDREARGDARRGRRRPRHRARVRSRTGDAGLPLRRDAWRWRNLRGGGGHGGRHDHCRHRDSGAARAERGSDHGTAHGRVARRAPPLRCFPSWTAWRPGSARSHASYRLAGVARGSLSPRSSSVPSLSTRGRGVCQTAQRAHRPSLYHQSGGQPASTPVRTRQVSNETS